MLAPELVRFLLEFLEHVLQPVPKLVLELDLQGLVERGIFRLVGLFNVLNLAYKRFLLMLQILEVLLQPAT